MKKTGLVVVALGAVVITASAWGQGGGRQGRSGPPGRGGMMMTCPSMATTPPQSFMLERMADMLQLSDDQLTKLKSASTKNEKTIQPLVQKAAEATQALSKAVLAAEFDATKVKDLATKAEKAEADVIAANIDAWAQTRAILTADQIKTLQQMTAQRPGMGRRGQGQPGQAQGQGEFGPPPGGPDGGPGGPPPGDGSFGPPPMGPDGAPAGPPPGDGGFAPPPPAPEE